MDNFDNSVNRVKAEAQKHSDGVHKSVELLKDDAALRHKMVKIFAYAITEAAKAHHIDADDAREAVAVVGEAIVNDTEHTTEEKLFDLAIDAAESFFSNIGRFPDTFGGDMHAKAMELMRGAKPTLQFDSLQVI